VLPEQNNGNIDDEVAANAVWKQSRHREDSIIVDLFCVSTTVLVSSTFLSRPNKVGLSVRPSVHKSFFDFNEIWYVGRGR